MPFNIGPLELIAVLAIALLILGPGKLPEVGAAFGKTIREFRRASTDIQDATDVRATPARPPAEEDPAAVRGTVADDTARETGPRTPAGQTPVRDEA